jgi:hypothetical protein
LHLSCVLDLCKKKKKIYAVNVSKLRYYQGKVHYVAHATDE